MSEFNDSERSQTIIPVWISLTRQIVSFNEINGTKRYTIRVPFPWTIILDPGHGAVLSTVSGENFMSCEDLVRTAMPFEGKSYRGFFFVGELPDGHANFFDDW